MSFPNLSRTEIKEQDKIFLYHKRLLTFRQFYGISNLLLLFCPSKLIIPIPINKSQLKNNQTLENQPFLSTEFLAPCGILINLAIFMKNLNFL